MIYLSIVEVDFFGQALDIVPGNDLVPAVECPVGNGHLYLVICDYCTGRGDDSRVVRVDVGVYTFCTDRITFLIWASLFAGDSFELLRPSLVMFISMSDFTVVGEVLSDVYCLVDHQFFG